MFIKKDHVIFGRGYFRVEEGRETKDGKGKGRVEEVGGGCD